MRGSVSAVNVDIDGIHIWAGDCCGANSSAGSDLDPIVKLDPDGNAVDPYDDARRRLSRSAVRLRHDPAT